MLEKLGELADRVGIPEWVRPGDLVAVKVHFGERGNTAFVPPFYVGKIVEKIRVAGGKPFVTDAGTLYLGSRSTAYDHILTAAAHGFTLESLGAPVIIADGLTGHDFVEVKVEGEVLRRAKVASAAAHADGLVAVSHLTGHELTGFGCAVKNVGMGLGSRGGKQQMHSDVKPRVNESRCTGCGKCVRWCPAGAISLAEGGGRVRARVDEESCLGCGECTVMCLEGAIAPRWAGDPRVSQRKIAEYAAAVLKGKEGRCAFFNFLLQMTPACDCWDYSDAPILPDIGILASRDLVAVDQASADLVLERAGRDLFRELYPSIDWREQLVHAERMGLGNRKYRLVDIG
jgi:uncharacterized Fe-S center protein